MHANILPPCTTVAELRELLTKTPHELLLLDVRSAEEFVAQHIPGAVLIPLQVLTTGAIELPAKRRMITVCAKGGGRSAQAAEHLRQLGYDQVSFLCGGTLGWFEEPC